MKTQPPRAFETPADLDAMVAKAREASEFLKALAQESRLLILCALAGGEKSVGELEAFLSQRQSTVSQQLARLQLENLVAARRDGATARRSTTAWRAAKSGRCWRRYTRLSANHRAAPAPDRTPPRPQSIALHRLELVDAEHLERCGLVERFA
jgi:DNA-binding transcriptional ArsR family regulator